jgi:hypothetical protein
MGTDRSELQLQMSGDFGRRSPLFLGLGRRQRIGHENGDSGAA